MDFQTLSRIILYPKYKSEILKTLERELHLQSSQCLAGLHHGKKICLETRGREKKSALSKRFTGLVEHSNIPSKKWVLLCDPPKCFFFDSAARTLTLPLNTSPFHMLTEMLVIG